MAEEVIHINALDVTFMTRRTRDQKEFQLLKESIRQIGQRTVLKVQDISSWPAAKRKRPDEPPYNGGHYKWRAAFGQGRCTAAIELYQETGDRSFLKIPALVVTNVESELAGMSMTENMLRKGYSWHEQARLMKRDLEQFEPAVVAKGYSISVPHLKKVMTILNKLSPKLEKELKSLTIAEAESLASLPQNSQEIVLEVMRDEGIRASSIPAIVSKAREVTDDSGLSKTALRASLRRVNEDLQKARESVKPLRLHYSLGSENVHALLTEKKHQHIRAAIEAAGINVGRFEEAMS